MALADDTVFRPSPRALLTELDDGSGVVLELDTKFYFNLNRSGVLVWKELSARPQGASARELAETLTKHFEVELEAALADVTALLGSMADEGLVKPQT